MTHPRPGSGLVRVVVVDDSATMRSMIGRALGQDNDIAIVGKAANSVEAQALIRAMQPDVITLDIEMPGMDGLEFLSRLMRTHPMPVVMVSMLTGKGTKKTLQALELGAVDCVAKPGLGESFSRLPEIVRAAAAANVHAWSSRPRGIAGEHIRAATPGSSPILFEPNGRLVALGASTGGVEALLAIVSRFPANCPPTVIAQHMPEGFTRSFALRMNQCSAAHVAEAEEDAALLPGQVFVAPGGRHLAVSGSNGQWHCTLPKQDLVNGHRPSVDVLFASVARAAGSRGVGVILTGMGRDGARGLLAMRQAGARTFGQDAASSVVYGMPKVAFEILAVERQISLADLPSEILAACNTMLHNAA